MIANLLRNRGRGPDHIMSVKTAETQVARDGRTGCEPLRGRPRNFVTGDWSEVAESCAAGVL